MGSVYIEFDLPAGIRDPQGRFTAAYNKLPIFYRRIAEELQEQVATTIEVERSVRDKNPRRGEKGTLAAVTRQTGNRYVSKNGFGVGIHAFLSKSAAKYYRLIEEGTQGTRYSSTMISGGWRPPGDEGYGTAYFIPAKAERRLTDLPRRDIPPLLAYSRAWHDLNVSGRLVQIWRQVLVEAGMVGTRGPLPAKYQFPSGGSINY